jgi:hypothetical protein
LIAPLRTPTCKEQGQQPQCTWSEGKSQKFDSDQPFLSSVEKSEIEMKTASLTEEGRASRHKNAFGVRLPEFPPEVRRAIFVTVSAA